MTSAQVVERSKLQEYYDGGIKTCGSDNTEKIAVAAEETGQTIDQVKKWIGNARQKEKISSGVQAAPKPIKIPTDSRGSHSYNMFCSEYFKSAKNCAELYRRAYEYWGKTISGVYTIDPDGKGAFDVYCDQTTAGGGWKVIQKRQNGSVDFNRTWDD
ncbi:Angiopoietin-2 [Stylophora pistillata]|uniref:Angiopoietin-2 n=1 Tax=Stylophora pistillata TaxID=50429 RepID=A0A2B4RG81_STYPI|nr:Angiopoietin-2 [Stylophora pistillata]